MNQFTVVCLLVLLPVCTGISCYSCSGLTSSACNDPFNAGGSGVTSGANSSNTYCVKVGALSIMTRYGSTSCSTSVWAFGSGTACCQTDLCNGAHVNYQIPIILLTMSLVLILAKFRWV